MFTYFVNRSNFALSTTNDYMTFITASNHPILLREINITGMGVSSAANEVIISRSVAGSGQGGLINVSKGHDSAPNAFTSIYTTWGVQPTLSGTPLLRIGVNANGGVNGWRNIPHVNDIIIPAGAALSIRSGSGTSNVTISATFTEI